MTSGLSPGSQIVINITLVVNLISKYQVYCKSNPMYVARIIHFFDLFSNSYKNKPQILEIFCFYLLRLSQCCVFE